MTQIRLRQFWLQIHKWIGLLLALLIIPLSISGAALVWHDALDRQLHPARYAITASTANLPVGAYVDAACSALSPGQRIISLRFASDAPVMAVATMEPPPSKSAGRMPERFLVWIDPGSAQVLDAASSNAGIVRFLHVLHGSLQIPGSGRAIVGWVGVALAVSCLSGIWLWWPTMGSWLRGLRWRRHRHLDANLHHLTGFWIAIPLLVVSVTGVFISFPAVMALVSGTSGQGDAAKARMQRMRAVPLEAPTRSPETLLRTAQLSRVAAVASLEWPTDQRPVWVITRIDGKPPVVIDDASGTIARPSAVPAPAPDPTMRLIRRIHDGTDMGMLWQSILFLTGLIPALLAATGILMWWRARLWRGKVKAKMKD